jgi:hypothetical protein
MSFIHDRMGGAPKAIELTPGNLPRIAIAATEKAERPSDRGAEVSRLLDPEPIGHVL